MSNLTDNDWYYSINGASYGPVKIEAIQALIQSRYLRPEHLVCQQGDSEWVALSASILSQPMAATAQQVRPAPQNAAGTSQTTADSQSEIGMIVFGAVLVIGIIAVWIFFPPSIPVVLLAGTCKLIKDKYFGRKNPG